MEEIINKLKISDLKLVEKQLGIPYDRMYKWIKGKSKPKLDDYNKLVNYFANGKTSNSASTGILEKDPPSGDLSYSGPRTQNVDIEKGLIPRINNNNKGVPYYDVDFMGGYDLVFNDHSIQPNFYIDFLPFNDCDCWINVSGKSMGPLIAHGDIVGLKKVDNWKRFLLEGEIYAVITDNGFRTIKMIGAGPDKDSYTLIPYNKSEEYKPQVIPKEVITHVFRVKGNIKKFF